MKRLAGITVALVIFGAQTGLGLAGNPGTTGQPNKTCLMDQSTALEPGNAAAAPGSAFNENGGTAGGVYAGSGANLKTPANGHAVSQYDVACFQFTAAHS